LTEAGVAIPPAVSTSGLRELSPLLHQRGPAALVEAWALVSERVDGRPSARAIRRVLLEADLPALSAADLSSRRGALADLADRLAGARAQLGRLRRERLPASSLQKLEALAREARQLANELDGLRPP
jgi:hypothetical protein